jgi:hypothetical protein
MGSTPIFATGSSFPDLRFENLDEVDLLSLHLDDFWGIPWDSFKANVPPPASWAAKWQGVKNAAQASGKTLYLSISPLGSRITLTRKVDVSGNTQDNWAPANADGCYLFSSDSNADTYKTAYVNYLEYLIALIQPKFLSPAIEINILFTKCPTEKDAWIKWYSDVYTNLKTAHPDLVIFPTFQLEHLYGVADAASACQNGLPYSACFEQRLAEILPIPGDRIAFSSYPTAWEFSGEPRPSDTFTKVQSATSRKIWISETGWPAVKVLAQYGDQSTACGPDLVPASIADDAMLDRYLSWLLEEARTKRFEAVVWWLHRDFLDGTVASACPCPGTNDTCTLTSAFRAVSPTAELLLRVFGNMGLRYYDDTPRAALDLWLSFLGRSLDQ